ncbi:MAG: GTP-binding protein [Asticcacaulis sp.]
MKNGQGKIQPQQASLQHRTIGHVDHGKTTLTAAIHDHAGEVGWRDGEELCRHRRGSGRERRAASRSTRRTSIRDGEPSLCPRRLPGATPTTWKNMITGAAQMDGAILVVSAADGPMPQTREHILLARQVGVPALVVYNEQGRLGRRRGTARTGRNGSARAAFQLPVPGRRYPHHQGSAKAATDGVNPEDR